MAGLLDDLPSRGNLVSVAVGSCRGRPPPSYVCDHETVPPEEQVLKHDKTNVIIRALQQKKDTANSKANQKSKATAQQKGKGKAMAGTSGQGALGKRSRPEGGHSGAAAKGETERPEAGHSPAGQHPQHTEAALQRKTVKELISILSSMGLSTMGKKPELVKRILQKQRSQQTRRK